MTNPATTALYLSLLSLVISAFTFVLRFIDFYRDRPNIQVDATVLKHRQPSGDSWLIKWALFNHGRRVASVKSISFLNKSLSYRGETMRLTAGVNPCIPEPIVVGEAELVERQTEINDEILKQLGNPIEVTARFTSGHSVTTMIRSPMNDAFNLDIWLMSVRERLLSRKRLTGI